MSPILVRPVREQLEHDRIIRLLQTRFRRRFDVGINPGAEQNTPVGSGGAALYPDVVLTTQDRGRKIAAVNLVNPGNAATRYVNPTTGRSVVVDDVIGEVIHVGGDGFVY